MLPIHMMHNPGDDLRVSYLEASSPLMKMSANYFSVDMCLISIFLSSTRLQM